MEVRKKVLERVPPGDRWEYVYDDKFSGEIFSSLTLAIEHCYLETNVRKYFVDAEESVVYAVEYAPDPPPRTYSIYGEYII